MRSFVPPHINNMPWPGIVRDGFKSAIEYPSSRSAIGYDGIYGNWDHTLDQNVLTSVVTTQIYDFSTAFDDSEFWGWDTATAKVVRAKVDPVTGWSVVDSYTPTLPASNTLSASYMRVFRQSATRILLVGAVSKTGSNYLAVMSATWDGTTLSAFGPDAPSCYITSSTPYYIAKSTARFARLSDTASILTIGPDFNFGGAYAFGLDYSTGSLVKSASGYSIPNLYYDGEYGLSGYPNNLRRFSETAAIYATIYNPAGSANFYKLFGKINWVGGTATPTATPTSAAAQTNYNPNAHHTTLGPPAFVVMDNIYAVLFDAVTQKFESWDFSGTPTKIGESVALPANSAVVNMIRINATDFIYIRAEFASTYVWKIAKARLNNDGTISLLNSYTLGFTQNPVTWGGNGYSSYSFPGMTFGTMLSANRALIAFNDQSLYQRFLIAKGA